MLNKMKIVPRLPKGAAADFQKELRTRITLGTVWSWLGDIVRIIIIYFLFGLYAMYAPGSPEDRLGPIGDGYLSVVIPAALITIVIALVFELLGVPKLFNTAATFLLQLGILLQCLLVTYTSGGSDVPIQTAEDVLVSFLAATIGGILLACLAQWLCTVAPRAMMWAVGGAILLLSLLLIVAGREVNGAKLYLAFGPSFHVPALLQYLEVVFLALVLSRGRKTDLWISLASMLVLTGTLVLANEFGTLVVLWIAYGFITLVVFPVGEWLKMVALVAALVAAALFVCYSAWKVVYKPVDSIVQEQPLTDDQLGIELLSYRNARSVVNLPGPSSVKEVEETDGEEDAQVELQEDPDAPQILRIPAKIFNKLYGRLLSQSGQSENLQLERAQEALTLAGFFGTEQQVYIPVVESDFVFVLLVEKLGLIIGFVALFGYLALMWLTLCDVFTTRSRLDGVLAMGSVLCLTVQAGVSAASATGVITTVGVGMPFISKGTTLGILAMAFLFHGAFANRKVFAKSEKEEELQ